MAYSRTRPSRMKLIPSLTFILLKHQLRSWSMSKLTMHRPILNLRNKYIQILTPKLRINIFQMSLLISGNKTLTILDSNSREVEERNHRQSIDSLNRPGEMNIHNKPEHLNRWISIHLHNSALNSTMRPHNSINQDALMGHLSVLFTIFSMIRQQLIYGMDVRIRNRLLDSVINVREGGVLQTEFRWSQMNLKLRYRDGIGIARLIMDISSLGRRERGLKAE